ncbi:HAD hydrolase-like protein, partial [Actinokineospora bangkokensis]
LLETRGVGSRLSAQAFRSVAGKDQAQFAVISGRTEFQIMRDNLALNDVDCGDHNVRAYAEALVEQYEGHRHDLATVGRVLPGVQETLDAVSRLPWVLQSVLTGNLRRVAEVKLETFGLASTFDLQLGSYGDDADERADLVQIARQRAEEATGARFPGARTVLIGDTENDVHAALAAGASVVGVATGSTSLEQLTSAGAHAVLDGLTPSSVTGVLTSIAGQADAVEGG